MLAETLRLALVLGLFVVLPGYLLINALLPQRTLRGLERFYLTLSAGILLLISVGLVLGFLPHGDRGYFSTFATGAPNVEFGMVALGLVLFWVGLHRGAYPGIAKRYPQLLTLGTRAAAPSSRGR